MRSLLLVAASALALCNFTVEGGRWAGVSAFAPLSCTEIAVGATTVRQRERRQHDTALLVRGGSLETVKKPLVQAFSFVSGSKTACWMVLILSIVTEGLATSLSKSARDTGDYARLLAAISIYIPW